jgi:energy-coupling factor transporter ATP-binding protein EcfA2
VATLEQIIQREANPFDSVTFRPVDFWTEDKQSSTATVESIHQEAITQIQDVLQNVIRDNRTRTVLLTGDSGCGKSYLLSRLKKTLNDRAFFAYIEPCSSNDSIWRHTLRYTVDSLMYVPEGEKESQLLLWLKGLSAYHDSGGIIELLLGKKNHFIRELRSIYPIGIYQPRDFFAVLYELTNPELKFSACDWLRGNHISEDELNALGVKSVIDSEEAAKEILGNFGRISADNKPIVLCFDQVEAARFPDGSVDLSSVFNVNTTFHHHLKNFLVIISIVLDKWRSERTSIIRSDLARIDREIILKQINLEQVEALWASRLYSIYCQAHPKPKSPIEPLKKQDLERKYPGGKANLRDSLNFGGKLFQLFKPDSKIKPNPLPAFQILWQHELNQNRDEISRICQLSAQQLIEMLISAMTALKIQPIKPRFLDGKYASYSFSYQPNKSKTVGILWNEDSNMRSFYFAMKACEKSIKLNSNITLKLIRAEPLGKPTTQGYKLYRQLFNGLSYCHITPDLESIHYLKTYQKLVNDARSGDLVLNFEPLSLAYLENLVRETKVLQQCRVLQDLEIVLPDSTNRCPPDPEKERAKLIKQVKEFLLNLVKHHQLLGQEILIKQTKSQFTEVEEAEIDNLIQELCEEKKISFVNPKAKPKERLVCLVPQ